jgi:hypothetical protein
MAWKPLHNFFKTESVTTVSVKTVHTALNNSSSLGFVLIIFINLTQLYTQTEY